MAANSQAERGSRPAWRPLAAAAVVVPTVLAGLTLLWPRPQIETELTRTGTEALAAAGFPGATLALNGRDATITGLAAGADRQRAIDAVQAVTGVRVAAVPASGGGNGAGAVAPAATPFGIARQGGNIVLTGVVGSAEQKAQLVAAATAQAGGRTVVDQLTVTPGAALPAGLDATSIGAATAAVAGGAGDLAVAIAPGGVTLTGSVPDDAARTAAAAAVTAALPGTTVDNRLTVAAPAATPPAPAVDLDAAAKAKLQASLTSLLAGAPITFGPDSPQLTAQGRRTVAKVVALLMAAPGARIEVDGYVATGRGNGRLTAQQLSEQRAAAVRYVLTSAGIPADRVTAQGKGEGSPIPGKRALGRRVAITVV